MHVEIFADAMVMMMMMTAELRVKMMRQSLRLSGKTRVLETPWSVSTVKFCKPHARVAGENKRMSWIIIIRCQIWNRHWRPCLSKHLCHQTTSKNLNPYFVHLLPSYKDYEEMLFVVCPYRVCLLLYQLKIRIPSLYVYTHVLKIPFASF